MRIVAADGTVIRSGLMAGPNHAGDQILLGASLRMKPGVYALTLTADGTAGAQLQTTLNVKVKPAVTVPSSATRPPVVLLNGWETGFTGTCPVATSSSDTFGNLAQYLVSDGVPVVYLFDNCLEDPGEPVQTLGNDLAAFLNSIQYDNGTQVPQIDLVAFSLGGLIARSYLAGLQPTETLAPPATTLVRDLVLIASPNFGSYVAENVAYSFPTGSQSAELVPGNATLWNLATWNQRTDDLRGVNAIAVIGNAGTYETTSLSLANAGDGLVSLTSAALGFTGAAASSTRIVPYCHVDPSVFTNTALGTYACNAGGIANVNSTSQYTGLIVRSFLSGTTAWQSIGTIPTSDPYLSKNGELYFGMVNSTASFVTDLTSVTFGSVALSAGADTGTIFYVDYVFGTGTLTANSTSLGSINCGSYAEPLGYASAPRCKLGPAIFSVGPLASGSGQSVNAGSSITLTGSGFESQCTGCKVVATQVSSGTSQQLTVTSWTNTAIKVNLPATMTGFVVVQVYAAPGTDNIGIMAIAQSTLTVGPTSLNFTYMTGGSAPAAQSVTIQNSGTSALNWTATASDSWITVSPGSGTAPSTLTVAVSPAGMSAGTYTGSVQITAPGSANSPASVAVTLTVTSAPAVLSVSPQSITFEYTYGSSAAAAQTVTVANTGGGTLAWTASASTYWLVVSPASGNTPGTFSVTINPANLAAGNYTGRVQVTAPGATGSPASIPVTLSVSGTPPTPAITGVANSASFQPSFAAATWVAIFGTNLSASTYSWQSSDFVNGQLPTSLEGVSATINGKPAYVYYISPTQINVLAPDDTATGTVQVQVTTAQQASSSFSATKTQFAPAFFTFDNGKYVAALHTDYSLVGAANLIPGATTQPAQPGTTLLLYATGFGPTNPVLPTAQIVTTPEPLGNAVQITVGGVNAPVTFGGLVGPGLYQFNVTVPNLPNGDAPVVATIGGVSSQTGVSLTIQQ